MAVVRFGLGLLRALDEDGPWRRFRYNSPLQRFDLCVVILLVERVLRPGARLRATADTSRRATDR